MAKEIEYQIDNLPAFNQYLQGLGVVLDYQKGRKDRILVCIICSVRISWRRVLITILDAIALYSSIEQFINGMALSKLGTIEIQILAFLRRRRRPLAIVDISRGLERSSSVVSKYVTRLEAVRLVKLDESQPPRKLVSLTRRGERAG